MKNNVIFLGCTQDFGYQFSAANTKTELIIRGLQACGDRSTIINGLVGSKCVRNKSIITSSYNFDIITYPLKINQFISWIFNITLLFNDLKRIKNKAYNNVIFLELPDYHIYLIYILLSRLLKFKLVVISHEWATTLNSSHWIRKPSEMLFSLTFGYMVDGILPISEYIIKHIRHFKKPFIKLPILADFQVELSSHTDESNYFLYCVNAYYTRVIYMIIDSYKMYLNELGNKSFILILSGSFEQISIVNEYIKSSSIEKNIILKYNISYESLLKLYRNADALLIPLDPINKQDQARFPQKVAEYLSSRTPLISNLVGEIEYYFTSGENIIIAPVYTVEGFCLAFKWVDNNPQKANIIGLNGYNLGMKFFNYIENGKNVHDFLLKI